LDVICPETWKYALPDACRLRRWEFGKLPADRRGPPRAGQFVFEILRRGRQHEEHSSSDFVRRRDADGRYDAPAAEQTASIILYG
jgi:hypothetical protein